MLAKIRIPKSINLESCPEDRSALRYSEPFGVVRSLPETPGVIRSRSRPELLGVIRSRSKSSRVNGSRSHPESSGVVRSHPESSVVVRFRPSK